MHSPDNCVPFSTRADSSSACSDVSDLKSSSSLADFDCDSVCVSVCASVSSSLSVSVSLSVSCSGEWLVAILLLPSSLASKPVVVSGSSADCAFSWPLLGSSAWMQSFEAPEDEEVAKNWSAFVDPEDEQLDSLEPLCSDNLFLRYSD